MKHLRRFNESISIEDIHGDVFDILVELRDSGFKIDLSSPTSDLVSVEIAKEGQFTISDIEDYLIRVTDYLAGLGYKNSDKTNGYGNLRYSNIYSPFDFSVLGVTKLSMKFTK